MPKWQALDILIVGAYLLITQCRKHVLAEFGGFAPVLSKYAAIDYFMS